MKDFQKCLGNNAGMLPGFLMVNRGRITHMSWSEARILSQLICLCRYSTFTLVLLYCLSELALPRTEAQQLRFQCGECTWISIVARAVVEALGVCVLTKVATAVWCFTHAVSSICLFVCWSLALFLISIPC